MNETVSTISKESVSVWVWVGVLRAEWERVCVRRGKGGGEYEKQNGPYLKGNAKPFIFYCNQHSVHAKQPHTESTIFMGETA